MPFQLGEWLFKLGIWTPKARITIEGGYAVLLTNKTGTTSVKGELVCASTGTDDAVELASADDTDIIGVMYSAGVTDGSEVWVVTSGIAEVLIEDGTTATRGYWAAPSSTTAGRADLTTSVPPGVVLAHFREIGHCIQSASSGTDVLARVVLHFN